MHAVFWVGCVKRTERMGGSAPQHTLYRGYAGRRPPRSGDGTTLAGNAQSPRRTWTEIRQCVAHVLDAVQSVRREWCGIRVTTAGLQGSILGIVHVSSRLCAVYAHVTPPFGNPLGYRGERPLLVVPFSTELADV